jgi:flagellar L-ring protein precursor FlgH
LARSAIGKVQQAGEAFNVTAEGAVDFAGKGAASAQNAFSGTITGTVLEVLANGNLVVGGEKQLAVSAEEEIIRFKGVVNPSDLVNNSITSSKVADLRLEYRGRGAGDDAQKPGWLTGLFLKVSPF